MSSLLATKGGEDVKKKISKELENKYDVMNEEDIEKWESGEYGTDPNHVKKALEFEKKTQHTSLRLPLSLIKALKKEAEEQGLPYQTFIRFALIQFLKTKNKVA